MRARIFFAAGMTLVASSAYAASNPIVTVPWGALVSDILAALHPAAVSLASLALAWLAARLGPDIARALHPQSGLLPAPPPRHTP